MKLIKKMKKGFTLVELVVVIAIIAILAGVSVGVYVGITSSAKKAADSEIITQLNTKLRADSILEGRNNTAKDAYDDAREIGFDLSLMTPQYGDHYIWDEEHDLFAVTKGSGTAEEIVFQDATTSLTEHEWKKWIFTAEPKTEEERSQFFTSEETKPELTVHSGFDVGLGSVDNLIYENNTSPITPKEAVIRTNGGVLYVNAPEDTVTHYGFATIVNCQDVKAGTYNEAGTVGRLIYSDASGAIKFNPTAKVYCYMNISNDNKADASDDTKEAGSIVYTNVTSAEAAAATASEENRTKGDANGTHTVTLDESGKVLVNKCHNHNTDYDVITIGEDEYVLCKCCGGFSLYRDGNKVDVTSLNPSDPSAEAQIPVSGEDSIPYVPSSHNHSGGTATCTNKAVCENCGQEYGEINSNNHDWNSWQSDGNGKHTRTCKNDSSHKEEGVCDTTGTDGACSKCGYKSDPYMTMLAKIEAGTAPSPSTAAYTSSAIAYYWDKDATTSDASTYIFDVNKLTGKNGMMKTQSASDWVVLLKDVDFGNFQNATSEKSNFSLLGVFTKRVMISPRGIGLLP